MLASVDACSESVADWLALVDADVLASVDACSLALVLASIEPCADVELLVSIEDDVDASTLASIESCAELIVLDSSDITLDSDANVDALSDWRPLIDSL